MKEELCMMGRSYWKSEALLQKIKNTEGTVIVSCYNKHHARYWMKKLRDAGFTVKVKCVLNKGLMPQPFTSRRSIHLEVLK